MKMKAVFFGVLLALAGFGPMESFARQDEDVRGAFLTTRPKTTAQSHRSLRRTLARRPTSRTSTVPSATVKPIAKAPTSARINLPRIGLGLTLFMRDSNGHSVRVDPSREFRNGDHVRVLLETNTDGYLYIFNTTDDGAPLLIFPDPELYEAGNFIQSHEPVEVPSSLAAEERLKWFTFDAVPGVEKLHFVFSREPLAAVPIEDDLTSYCRANKAKCPWTPGAELWATIQKEMAESKQIAKPTGIGKTQTESERQAATRGIGLNRDDAEPSLIMLTASTSKGILVATLNLVHKLASLPGKDSVASAVVQNENK